LRLKKDEMSRDIVLTSDFIRVRHIMLNVDLDRLKVLIVQEVFVREVDAKVAFPT
jgi:hypothetical protein